MSGVEQKHAMSDSYWHLNLLMQEQCRCSSEELLTMTILSPTVPSLRRIGADHKRGYADVNPNSATRYLGEPECSKQNLTNNRALETYVSLLLVRYRREAVREMARIPLLPTSHTSRRMLVKWRTTLRAGTEARSPKIPELPWLE